MEVAVTKYKLQSIFDTDLLLVSGGKYVNSVQASHSIKEIETFRQMVHGAWISIYKDFGNAIFDTDGDGVFDNVDPMPLDPTCSKDTDGDNVCDERDVAPADASKTWKLQVGESAKHKLFEIKRTGENTFEIAVTFKVQAANAESRKYLAPSFLKKLSEQIKKDFAKALQPGNIKCKFTVNFKSVSSGSADIIFDKHLDRSSSRHWGPDILERRETPGGLHETCHRIYTPEDYYNEPLRYDGVKDYTLRPGFEVLGESELMACVENPKISQASIANMIAFLSTSQDKTDEQNFRYTPLTITIAGKKVSEFDFEEERTYTQTEKILFKKRCGELEQLLSTEKDPRQRTQLFVELGNLQQRLGDIDKAEQSFVEVYNLNKKDDNSWVCNSFIALKFMERYETALKIAEEHLNTQPHSWLFYNEVTNLVTQMDAKTFEKYAPRIEQLVKKVLEQPHLFVTKNKNHWLALLGKTFLFQQRFGEALELTKRLLRQGVANSDYRLLHSIALFKNGKPEDALITLEQAVELFNFERAGNATVEEKEEYLKFIASTIREYGLADQVSKAITNQNGEFYRELQRFLR